MNDDVSTAPTTALIVRPRVLPTTAQLSIEWSLAWRLRNARGFLPNHFMLGDEQERAAKILAAIEYARAVGIEPMIALQNTQIIDGKVGASALLIGALLRKAGYTITDDTNDERSIVTVAKNGSSARGEFSMQDAERADLLKPKSGWTKYPRDMMYARALTQAARRGAQDAVLGMAYTAEELGGVEEEIAGVPSVIEGQAVEVTPGEPATTSVPPATPAEALTPTAATLETQPVEPVAQKVVEAAPTPQDSGSGSTPPQTAPNFTPLGGAAVNRRMGRSIGPAPKRTKVVTVEPQAPTVPATAPGPAPAPAPQPDPVPPQPAPSGLTDEPVPAPAPPPPAPVVDEGERQYNSTQREELRKAAAALTRINRIFSNHLIHALKNEPLEVVTPAEPNPTSDEALRLFIEKDYPGRSLENLGTAELQNRLELVEASLQKKRATLTERGITEE